ncbi:MAG: hypothetical protein ACUBOA_04540 [Candidatus Loosdrechtia sp.]|uniref:hypothetical protein n=1 Tax=Candidatus Loosdrechtia sp. TaxID=3101272 RepID=UPI003A734539|nr:MAG: hypothetical protein QY305_12635 [Candidatus Jettenia sp. AMX2]
MDKEISDFCEQEKIASDVETYYKLILETFQNIEDIKVTLQSDYEIENYRKVRFDVKINDKVDNIIKREKEFRNKIRNLISKDSRSKFVLTFQIA